jgi:hypothetical protein
LRVTGTILFLILIQIKKKTLKYCTRATCKAEGLTECCASMEYYASLGLLYDASLLSSLLDLHDRFTEKRWAMKRRHNIDSCLSEKGKYSKLVIPGFINILSFHLSILSPPKWNSWASKMQSSRHNVLAHFFGGVMS